MAPPSKLNANGCSPFKRLRLSHRPLVCRSLDGWGLSSPCGLTGSSHRGKIKGGDEACWFPRAGRAHGAAQGARAPRCGARGSCAVLAHAARVGVSVWHPLRVFHSFSVRTGWAGTRCSADTRPPHCGGRVCARGLVAQLFAKLRVSRNSCLQLFVKR